MPRRFVSASGGYSFEVPPGYARSVAEARGGRIDAVWQAPDLSRIVVTHLPLNATVSEKVLLDVARSGFLKGRDKTAKIIAARVLSVNGDMGTVLQGEGYTLRSATSGPRSSIVETMIFRRKMLYIIGIAVPKNQANDGLRKMSAILGSLKFR